MSDLSLVRLGDICLLKAGNAFPKEQQGVTFGDVPFIKVSDFELPGNERRITRANNFLSEATALDLKVKRHRKGGVAFAKIGIALTYNRRRLLTRDTAVDNNLMVAEAITELCDDIYFYYLLRTVDFNLIANGSALPYLNASDIRNIEVAIHAKSEQKAIAHILGALDDKIELNRKTNETLEAMAKALFKSWFVDFDPVRAKAEGRPTGLPAEISDLFPDSFEDSELGEIPSGWAIAEINQIVNLKKDSVDPSTVPEETFDHYSIPAFDAGKHPGSELGSSIKSQKFLVGNDDLLVSKLNPSTPRVWIPFSSSARRSICSTEFLVCQASTDVGRAFVYCLASSDSIIEVMTGLAGGTSNSHQRIRPGDFLALDCCIGSQEVRAAFSDVVEPLLRKTLAQKIENRSLASARDALLPKLISGEIRIPDAEKMLEEVGI